MMAWSLPFILLIFLLTSKCRCESNGGIYILVEENGYFSGGTNVSVHLNKSILAIDGRDCDEFSVHGSLLSSGVEKIHNALLARRSNHLVHFGLVCKKCTTECSILRNLLRLFAIEGLIKSVATILPSPVHPLLLEDKDTFSMAPPVNDLIFSFFSLCRSFEWKRIGIIYDSQLEADRFSNFIQHLSQEERSVSISLKINLNAVKIRNSLINYIVKSVKDSGTKVILLLGVPFQITEILCMAHANNMLWPEYAWVVHTLPNSNSFSSCNYPEYLENAIFLRHDFKEECKNFAPNNIFSLFGLRNNLYVDAVGLLITANRNSLNLTAGLKRIFYSGITGNVTFNAQRFVARDSVFLQVRSTCLVAQAHVREGTVQENKWLLNQDQVPSSELKTKVNTVYPLWLNIVEIVVCTLATTVVLIFFVYFRREPEIRATSWLLSLLMIVSCYLVVVNLLTHAIHTSLPPLSRFNTCSFLIWISGYGVPQTLIIAVLLVKMLRVYHIFHNSRKLGKISTDYAMAVYILLILSPNIIVLTVMTVLGSYQVSIVETFHADYVEIIYVCKGNLTVYFQILLVYLLILVFCTAIVAWSTRKLRLKHFRDAKKVNGFFLTFVFIIVPSSVLYGVFRGNDLYLHGYIIIHVCYNWLIFSCLGFLFVPKIWPLIRKYSSQVMLVKQLLRKRAE